MKIKNINRYSFLAVGLMAIENLFRYPALAVGLKPSASQGEARPRGLWRNNYSKTIISVTVWGARYWECSTLSNWFKLYGNCYKTRRLSVDVYAMPGLILAFLSPIWSVHCFEASGYYRGFRAVFAHDATDGEFCETVSTQGRRQYEQGQRQ